MHVSVERIYDYSPSDEHAVILVDRLWPRGVAKEDLGVFAWEKILTPSNELRQWFHEDKDRRFTEFSEKYETELSQNAEKIKGRLKVHTKPLLLLTAVKDIEQSHIPTLTKFLSQILPLAV